jgi:hypothetical protein
VSIRREAGVAAASAVSLVAAGCGAGSAETFTREGLARAKRCVPEETTTTTLPAQYEDVMVKDAGWYAEDQGISLEEAVRRMKLQEDPSLKRLQPELTAKKRDTFAGLWIQHKPEYRYVVLFTEGGEETIRPYLECNPHAAVVEVRNGADATLAEPMAAQEEAVRITDGLGIAADSATYAMKNRVELNVTDRAAFEAALQDAGELPPQHVIVFEVESLAQPGVRGGAGEEIRGTPRLVRASRG